MNDNQNIDVVSFWDKRHAQLDTLRSGGDRGISPEDNYEFYIYRLAKLLEYLRKYFLFKKPLTILDAGCGKGFFTDWLYRCGHDIQGIDSSESAIRYAKENSSAKFLVSEIQAFQQKKLYDVAICIDVLFHILDDEVWEKTIKKFCSFVHHNGLIIITDSVPISRKTASNYIVYRSLDEYVQIFRENNFILDKVDPYDFGINTNKFLIFKSIYKKEV